MKICTRCKIEKDFSQYSKQTGQKLDLNPQCKCCASIYNRNYILKNKERLRNSGKDYYKRNKENLKKASLKYYFENHEKNKERKRKYCKLNKVAIWEKNKK